MAKLVLDPLTRIEGHLRIDVRTEQGKVAEAWSKGEMFRGFESILSGRDPFDAPVITQRICGVCPVSHAVASCLAVEGALGITPSRNGRLLRSLTLGANFLQSHILHFYQLAALDFVDVKKILAYQGKDPVLKEVKAWASQELASNRVLPLAPFLPRIPGDYAADTDWNIGALTHYLEALEVRQEAHRMAAIFGGKMPHTASLVPGGVTCGVDVEEVENFRSRLRLVSRFIENVYIPDVLLAARHYSGYADIGKGVGRFLSYGVFEESRGIYLPSGTVANGRYASLDSSKITEELAFSRYEGDTAHPSMGSTVPQSGKADAYTWIKAPRYAGEAFEVGPLARILVAYHQGMPEVRTEVDGLLAATGLKAAQLDSVLGRHAARALEARLVARRMETWLDELEPGKASVTPYEFQADGQGEGLTEAPRGALGHWLKVEKGRISHYQSVVPSTWNFSPRSSETSPGPVEAALLDTPIEPANEGMEVARVVRSFDPCIACAIH